VRREHEEAKAMGEEGPLMGRTGTLARQSVTVVPESYKIRREFPETLRGDFRSAEGTTSMIMTEYVPISTDHSLPLYPLSPSEWKAYSIPFNVFVIFVRIDLLCTHKIFLRMLFLI
jgi:hypothetical protein